MGQNTSIISLLKNVAIVHKMGKVKKENSIIPSFNPVCIFQWIFKTTLNELLQKCNHGSISYYTNVAFSLPSYDIHSFIHQQLQNAYYVPGTGV